MGFKTPCMHQNLLRTGRCETYVREAIIVEASPPGNNASMRRNDARTHARERGGILYIYIRTHAPSHRPARAVDIDACVHECPSDSHAVILNRMPHVMRNIYIGQIARGTPSTVLEVFVPVLCLLNFT